MISLAPQDYESLPALESPAGYICVIRDIDRDRYRIEATRSPRALIDAVVAEEQRSFGIELVSLLRTDDLAASEAELYARHHARLSSDWLELDALQLEELRQSALLIDDRASLYLMSATPASVAGGPGPAGSHNRPRRASAAARRSNRRAGGVPAGRPVASHHYGNWAMRRRRRESPDAVAAGRATQANSSWRDELLGINPLVGFVVILIVVFIAVGMLRVRTFYRGADEQASAVAVVSPTIIPARQAPRPTPQGKPFLVAQRAPAHICPSISCRLVQLLPETTQIWGLQAVKGSPVNGSTIWIEFRLQGTSFVPISYLVEPPD